MRLWRVWWGVNCVYIHTHINIYHLHGYLLHPQGHVYYKQLQSLDGCTLATWMLCCFRGEHLEPLHLLMCYLMRCMFVEGCGEVPQEWPAGGTPTSSSFGHPERALQHRPMSCTYLELWPALLQTRLGWEGQSPVTTGLFLHLCRFSWQPLEDRMPGIYPMSCVYAV